MTFVIILLGVLLSGSLFSLGFMAFIRQRKLLGAGLVVIALALFVSMFIFIQDAPPIQTMD